MPASPRAASRAPAYQRIADELAALIAAGSLAPGERLPSVRGLSRQKRVSATSAVASLRDLERRGLVEARPQSGFFVRCQPAALAEPLPARPPAAPRPVGVSAVLARLVDSVREHELAPLGNAIPDAAWFPARALQRELLLATRRHPRLLVEYASETAGLAVLRHEIARHYAHLGCRLREDELTVTSGCMEALNLAVRAVCRPGETIAVESPTYFGFLQIVESLGLKVIELPSHPRDGLSVDALEDLLASRAGRAVRACVVIGNFNNPTGSLLSEARKRRLVEVCRRGGIALIEDDIYGDLQHSGPRPLPAKAFDTEGDVILCSSFSKTLAPGLRIGFISGGKLAERIRMTKFITSIASPPILQQAVAGLLRSGRYERHLLKVRRQCAEQVARMSAAVEASFPAGTRLSRPQGGFVLWVELPGDIDTVVLHAEARAQKLDFVPGPLFSATGAYRNGLRLNCGRRWNADTERAVLRLGALVHRALGSGNA